MKIRALSRDQVRSVDQTAIEEYGMSGLVLMENAGRGAAEVIQQNLASGRVVILCGKGNNGGDGYVIARHLDLMERDVVLVSVVEISSLSGDAAANTAIATRAGLDLRTATTREEIESSLAEADVIVDCLLGTGATGPLRGIYSDAVQVANRSRAARVAIDVPTGLDVDTGDADPNTFRAELTITFVAKKIGFEFEGTQPFLGDIEVVPIGVPRKLLHEFCS
ncbi:NAD(P)H-hydrate epimerase [Novipirellula sp. SH528]|uniref:NAD(P)H-hydrate epimerase n=1 Tax=Novipirellula sp. SH528 TaxID=3454466 RepID=UPI003FA01B5C